MDHFLLKLHLSLILLCVCSIECRNQPRLKKQSSFIISNEEMPTWTCPFKDSDKNESKEWDIFLNKLFCKLSQYKVQVAKRNQRVNNAVDSEKCEIQKLVEEAQATQIDENNFENFLNKLTKCNIAEYDTIKDIKVTGKEIEELNHLLDLTLKDKVQVNCNKETVTISGNYITAGDIIDTLNLKRIKTGPQCQNLLSSDKEIFLNIFALNTFFIDVNVTSSSTNSHKIVLMNAIAPKWEVIGKNKIELKGKDGEPPSAALGNKMNGNPGNPGSPGGNFFGIGSKFVNGMDLEISVSGGDGSDGLEGKKGEDGVDGQTPNPTSSTKCSKDYCEKNAKINDFDCKKIETCTEDWIIHGYMVPADLITNCKFEVYGKTGTEGKNGGEGGKGGSGGYPGSLQLIELKRHSQINQIQNTGQNGSDGKGGAGGLGGRKGNDITVKCKRYLGFKTWDEWTLLSTSPSNENAKTGQNGNDGGNTQGMETPKSAVAIHNLDKARTINEYKSFVRENLHERFTNYFLNGFLNHLESNTDVKNLYNTISLIDDLQNLEDQVHRLNTDVDFIPFYQSFLKRTREYANDLKEKGDPTPYKRVLSYLYTAALGTVYNIEDNLESNVIVDIYAYLSAVKKDLEKITDLENSKYKGRLINKYKKEYKRDIDKKIHEARELITNEINPEIHNVGDEIDKQVETLVNEVILLQKDTDKEHKKLIDKREELKNILAIEGIFSFFKIFSSVASFLGPVGKLASTVIDKGTTIAQVFVSTKADTSAKVLELPQSASEIQSINDKLKNITDKRMSCLKTSIKEVTDHPDILKKGTSEILSINDKLDKLDKNKINLNEIQDLENKLVRELQIQEVNADSNNTKTLIKNMGKNIQFCSLLSDSYSKYKNSEGKLDAINNAIEQNEANMKKLKDYEQKVYNSITPMLQNIQSDLQNIIGQLGKKSEVSLDVTRWHVNTVLRDMILLMRQLTKGFKMEENLSRCLQKLEEGMNALINVHQHIQDYQKDQNLATYIAEISSVSATDIVIANNEVLQEKLRNAVHNLEITVRSNIVVQRYKIAMSAFKQFVFPFAHKYFKGLTLPLHLTSRGNENKKLKNLVSKAAVELEKIKAKLDEYKITVTNQDGCIGAGEFRSGYVSNKPFFVWKNEEHNKMISKLLSGKTVMVKADVKSSAPGKDAIKFTLINFNIKSRNEAFSTEINNKLNGFQITVDHLGNSDYRYQSKIYEMRTGSQEIWYYFEKKQTGEPVSYSRSYGKIMNGTETLSPYASWKIKLDAVSDDVSFDDLKTYKDSVDLVLEGYGYFLNKRSKYCVDLMVDKYYKPIGNVDSDIESHRSDNMYQDMLQDNIFKIFKRFF